MLETTPYFTLRKNFPFEDNQIQSSGKGGYQTLSGGIDGGMNCLLILQNLSFMRVLSHHSSGFTQSLDSTKVFKEQFLKAFPVNKFMGCTKSQDECSY